MVADRYRVVEPLGQGGMGQVLRCEDLELRRDVAIKMLLPHWLGSPSWKEVLTRFKREGRAAARMAHANVARVYDTGEHDGLPYLVLEYLQGQDLKSLLDQNPGGLPYEQVLDFTAQAADGLAAAHRAGVVHRDIKPANLMLTTAGTVKVCDFGIARLHDATSGLTVGAGPGTDGYRAPELFMGEPANPRTDLYALGATIFQLLTGRIAFTRKGRTVMALRADTPRELGTFLKLLMAKEPDRRPSNAAIVAERLRELQHWFASPGHPINKMRASLDEAVKHGEAGRPGTAVTLLQSLVSDYLFSPHIGFEHPDALRARQSLAYWAGKAGDPATACDQYAHLLLSYAHVRGLDHPETLATLHELVRWADAARAPAAAREALAVLLPAYDGVFGTEHPHTVVIRDNLARWASMAAEGR